MSAKQLAIFDPIIAQSTDISAISSQFRKYPLLDKTQELELAIDFYKNKNQESAHKLVLANMRYVIRIAKSYAGYGLPIYDLVQEGCIGLMKSIKSFNPNKGVRLLTYATYWIKSEVQEYIIKNWRLVKIASTKAQRKLFFNLRSLKKKISWLSRKEISEVARDLDVSEKDVLLMESRLSYGEQSLDCFDDEKSSNDYYLHDNSYAPFKETLTGENQSLYKKKISEALSALSDREKRIIQTRWLTDEKMPFKELSKILGISIERTRQLELSAMDKMKKVFKKDGDASFWLGRDVVT